MRHRRLKNTVLTCLWFLLALVNSGAAQSATPAEMISDYRLQHGEGRVKIDATLNRIARDQAEAMAAKDVLDHSVLASFSTRVAPAGSERAAENIAYGYESFPKTLNQWIESSGHRKNLLLHGAERVGIASAKSTATGRTYWAMEIAGGYEEPKRGGAKLTVAAAKSAATKSAAAKSSAAKSTVAAKTDAAAPQACRLKILSLCL
jgi:Cysteine-rich secretory protein family